MSLTKSKNENWQKRKAKAKGIKGGGYEYEVSDIINKFELLQNYDKDSGNRLEEPFPDYNKSNKILLDDDFFKNYVLVGDLDVKTTDNGDLKITTKSYVRYYIKG